MHLAASPQIDRSNLSKAARADLEAYERALLAGERVYRLPSGGSSEVAL